MKLFMDYRTFLRSKRWDSLVQSNPKVAASHICALLQPAALKSRVKNDLSMNQKDIKKNFKSLYKYVIEKTVACEEFATIKPAVTDKKVMAHVSSNSGNHSHTASKAAHRDSPAACQHDKTKPGSAVSRTSGSSSTLSLSTAGSAGGFSVSRK
jgi:hypothetical protein